MEYRSTRWTRPLGWVAAVCLASTVPVSASTAPNAESELLRGAQMWAAKNRPDLARQLIEKLLLADRYSPIGLATLGDLALRENKTEDAQRFLDILRAQHPQNPLTKDLETLIRVYGPEREKLAEMRLMARAGRVTEAAQIARTLFPAGPPTLGNLALEYFQIVGAQPGAGPEALHQLEQLFRQTGESRYQLAWLEIKLAQGARPGSVLPDIETLATQQDVQTQALQALWRRALDQLGNSAASLRPVQAFLRRFPGDTAMVERLAALQQAQERAARKARDPARLARDAARRAFDQGDIGLAEEKLHVVLALRPRDAESIGELGLIRLRQGQHTEAQELFSEAYALSNQRKWADLQATARFWGLLRQVDRALEKGELGTADELARKALALQPDNAEALSTLAGIRVLQNTMPQAQSLYEQALRQEPDNSAALKGLAALYARTGQPEKGLTLLEQAVTTDETLAGKLAGTRADILQGQAEALMEAQRPSAALQTLEAAVVLVPNDPWVRHSLAQIYVHLGLPKEALNVMNEGIARTPGDPQMRYARALIRSALEDEVGALSDLQYIAPATRSEGMRELAQRASVQQLTAQAVSSAIPNEAQALLERAEALARNDASLLYSVANAWFKRSQPALGVAVFDRLEKRAAVLPAAVLLDHAALLNRAKDDDALEERLPHLLAMSNWSSAQETQLLALYGDHRERQIERKREAGHPQQAVQLARAPMPNARTPSANVQRRRVQAQLLAAAGEYADATTLLTGLVQEQPQDSTLHMALGDALSRQGRKKEATEQARWLQQHLSATDVTQQLALLRLWQRAGQMDAAHALSQQLLQSAPADTDVLLHAARLERAQRNYAQAVALFQQAQTLEQHTADLRAPAAVPAQDVGPDGAPLILVRSTHLALPPDTAAPASNTVALDAAPDDAPLVLVHSTHLSLPANAPTPASNTVLAKIESEINTIQARRQAWIEGGQQTLQKSGSAGISSLRGWERPLVAWIPTGYDGHHFLHVDQVSLDAGKLPLDATDALRYGQVAAWPRTDYRVGGDRQRATANNVGFGFVGDTLAWDIGATGIGFPVTNWVGGIAHSNSTDRFNYKFELSRRPLTGSFLSYAGAHDPITGQIWGGVVATGASARVSTDVGAYSTSLSASYALLTGTNVRNNTRLQMRWAADRDIWKSRDSAVNLSLALSGWHYGHDLSEFSWGHGGYYSPRSYVSLAMPIEWSGRKGAWTWLVRAALSVSRSASSASAFFPGNAVLQAQAQGQMAALGDQPLYGAGNSTGLGRSFRGVVEHHLSPQLTLGAQLELDRSAYYTPTNLLLYMRYRFDPVLAPQENRPRPVQTYSSF